MPTNEFRPPVRHGVARVIIAILPLLVVAPALGLAVTVAGGGEASYTIADGKLVVRSGDRLWGERTVLLSDVTEARTVSLRGGRRTKGTALAGFCAGHYSYADLGPVWQVTTCAGRGVLVRAPGEAEPLLVSPPDPDAFVAALQTATPTTITLPPPDRGPVRAITAVVALVGVMVAGMVSALMLLGPARMRYLVGDGALEVRTLFGRKRWPTAGARARGHTPTRLRRIAGTSAPGYHTGYFRESGETTRVYATAVDRVILFESSNEGGVRVLLSPEDRVAFLRALEAEGAAVEHHA